MVEDTIPESLKRAEDFINQRLAQAQGNKIPRSKPYKKKEKIKIYTVVINDTSSSSSPYQGTFRTKKEAIIKLKTLLSKNSKRDKETGLDYCYDFFDEDGNSSGYVYIVEAEI